MESITPYKSKRKQIEELCDALEFPIYFPDDIEKHENKIIMKRSDGYNLIYSVEVRPKLINDNSLIELEVRIEGTGIRANLNNIAF